MRKSDGVRVHHKKEQWGESSPWENKRWGRVDHQKRSDGVRVHHKKEQWGESLPCEKQRWGES